MRARRKLRLVLRNKEGRQTLVVPLLLFAAALLNLGKVVFRWSDLAVLWLVFS
ncbi:uncharacterized protein TTMY_0104 [Thermus thermophilus]|uniref:hypothetical protein n=1 Tax=Thermus thermophilus TaxID=274 RepID=UPI00090AF1A1|nr:hypothetical protein [Thermus thermophilus]BAW00518.1 uncharacterized protein TTMY_0104 [Thermus thermophilus]BDB11238.1 hypothetical protein TthTMY_09770 [Thermus thermophilus]